MTDRETVGQALNYVLSVLDIVAGMALSEKDYDEVAEEEVQLGQIASRVQLILSFIKAQRPAPSIVANMEWWNQ